MFVLMSSMFLGCGEEEPQNDFSNLPPFSPIVDLQPSVPYTDDDLEAIIISNSIDPDGNDVVLSYLWYKDDELQTDLTGTTVSTDLTERGEIWTVAVISNDGSLNSADTRRSVTIRNSLPSIDSTMLMWVDDAGEQVDGSTEPVVDDDLSAHVGEHIKVGATAIDTDVTDELTFVYEWEVDGTVIDLTEDILPADQLVRGQDWIVRITPNDGLTDGEPVEVLFGFYNAIPVIDSISVSPEEAEVGDTLSCSATATDDDDDISSLSIAYTWTITAPEEEDEEEGGNVSEESGEVLDTTSLISGSGLLCTAVASDGMDESEGMLSAEITLTGNTLPVIDSVSITPEDPTVGTALTCEATATDYEESDLTYSYSWMVDDVEAIAESDGTLSTTELSVDSVITCTAIANDGEDDSLPDSAEITLGEAE